MQADLARLPTRLRACAPSQRRLPAFLAVIAGMVDLTGFLNLGNIFTAHITGNLVVLAAAIVRGGPLNVAQALAIPTFMLTVAAVWLSAPTEAARHGALTRRLLVVQFLLLAAVSVLCGITRPSTDPRGLMAGIAIPDRRFGHGLPERAPPHGRSRRALYRSDDRQPRQRGPVAARHPLAGPINAGERSPTRQQDPTASGVFLPGLCRRRGGRLVGRGLGLVPSGRVGGIGRGVSMDD